ncbi:MAG TPA: gamma-glutamyl-phosphate reductase, partial [Planctomycetota bacterium]|nr:gamma-glutamyl-phosphate reductase [Planctomycetota bacterium]
MIETIARQARAAAVELAALDTGTKNRALANVLAALEAARGAVQQANAEDRKDATRLIAQKQLSAALAKRLDLSGEKYDAVLAGIRDVIQLPDPVGRVDYARQL